MVEAEQTTNPMRLLVLGWEIRDELEKALKAAPDDVEVRLDVVRWHVMSPGIVGGSIREARDQAAEIAKRDAALGAFARGYIAYREKEYAAARRDLQAAAKAEHVRERALTWLGWLSQETQQYETAFDVWKQLDVPYEIGRTSVFCRCRLAEGEAALKRAPRTASSRYYLGLVHELRGDRAAARRAIEEAWKMDKSVAGLKEARKRLAR